MNLLSLSTIVLSVLLATGAHAADFGSVSAAIVEKQVPRAEWKKFMDKAKSMYETRLHDSENTTMKSFLDSKVKEVIPSILSSDNPDDIKKIFCWLAMYQLWDEAVPGYLLQADEPFLTELEKIGMKKDFTWTDLSDFIREKARKHKEEIKHYTE